MKVTIEIRENGIEQPLTVEQADRLIRAEAIYRCDECTDETEGLVHVYHVMPDEALEDDYLAGRGLFAVAS